MNFSEIVQKHMNERRMENISDGRIENGFILASRIWRSDPGQGLWFGVNGCFASPARARSFGKSCPIPTDLILAVAFDGAGPAEWAIVLRVLQPATQRLNKHISGGNQV